MSADYHTIPLFGGAITTDLPTTFADVSDIRQVPDNQEVYLDKNGFTSIVFDILERVEDNKSDIQALEYHLHDIVEEDAGEMRVWNSSQAVFAKLPKGTPAYTLLATSPPGFKQRGRPNEPDFVAILLTLVRLERQKTDIVIAINVPHVSGQYEPAEVDPEKGKEGPLLERARALRERVLGSFEVRDWGLFVEEG